MPVGSKEFQRWVDADLGGDSWGNVCKRSGVKRTTLHQQLVRGRVAESTVVAVARGYSLSVVGSLAHFEGYEDLPDTLGRVTQGELLSQIHYIDVLSEILGRAGRGQGPQAESDLVPLGFKDSARSWVDAIDNGSLRQRVSDTWGVQSAYLSTQLRTKLPPHAAVDIARHAHVAPVNGLVVIGLVTQPEGQWPIDGRISALQSLPDRELITWAVQKLNVLKRAGTRKTDDERDAETFWEHLG